MKTKIHQKYAMCNVMKKENINLINVVYTQTSYLSFERKESLVHIHLDDKKLPEKKQFFKFDR